jgi:hypothetical protein
MIVCSVCGTEDWIRLKPGELADATPASPHCVQDVHLTPQPAIASIAWCHACDPLIRRAA